MERFIILYREDYDCDIWEQYCEICGVSTYVNSLSIKFNTKDVKAEYDEYEEAEIFECAECGFQFTEDEITGMDEDGNDLCPACGRSI